MMKYLTVVLLLIFAAACNGDMNITAPASQPVPVPVTSMTFVVSGIVTERTATGPQTVAGAQVGLYAYNEGPLDPSGLVMSTQTGPDGRYSIEGTPQVTWMGVHKPEYRAYEARCCSPGSGAIVLNIELLR